MRGLNVVAETGSTTVLVPTKTQPAPPTKVLLPDVFESVEIGFFSLTFRLRGLYR